MKQVLHKTFELLQTGNCRFRKLCVTLLHAKNQYRTSCYSKVTLFCVCHIVLLNYINHSRARSFQKGVRKMEILGINLAIWMILIGGAGIVGVFFGYKPPKLTTPTTFFVCAILLGAGVYIGGYADTLLSGTGDTDTGDADTDTDQYTTGLTGIIYLKDLETRSGISGKTLGIFPKGTTIQDVQSSKITPLATSAAVTDSNGKTTFTGLKIGDYTIAFWNDEAAFDGTDYMAVALDVTIEAIDKDLKTKETYFEPNDSLYTKKIGDVFYTITATSGSNFSSGGVNGDATITEAGTGGTTVHVTISCNTDQAWLTDTAYHQRAYLTGTFTDNGGDQTDITLADCKMNSSTGQNLTKDSSGSYYVDVTSSVMKNTTKNDNLTFSFTIWCTDLGTIDTTADIFAIMVKHTLVRKDTSNVTILQDTGHKVTITQANDS